MSACMTIIILIAVGLITEMLLKLQILNNDMKLDDDETQNCFLNTDLTDDTIDTGGITIPAGFELQVSL